MSDETLSERALNWAADILTFSDIIDLYFIMSDLFDIDISDYEKWENAYGDAECNRAASGLQYTKDASGNEYINGAPIGKVVL